MSATVEHMTLDGGVDLAVEVSGAGPAIVLLHGFTGDATTMGVLTERLEPSHTVIVPNLIGHGGSSGPTDHYSVDAMAVQVLAAVVALGHREPIDLVGYSMGGRVALTIACRHPAHVASVVLIGASAGIADAGERAERVSADEALAASILDDGLEAFVDRWMANPLFETQSRLGPVFLAAARAQRLRNSPHELARSLRGGGTGTMRPLHDLLGSCRMPVTFVVGADDAKFGTIAEELADGMPDARIATVADAGHAAHLEQPDAVVAEIDETIARSWVRVHRISIPLTGAHTTGRGTTRRRDGVLLALRRRGTTGWGEASPLPGWSLDDLGSALEALDDHPPAFGDAASAWDATAGWRRALSTSPAARAAVAGAALDLDARLAGVPLASHLASWHPDLGLLPALGALAVNGLVSAVDLDDVATEVGRFSDAGFDTVKLKVGALDPADDLARIAIAGQVAPHMTLRIDANGAWDHDTAIAMLAGAVEHGVVLCEEPVRGIDAIAAVGRVVDLDVAVDESARTLSDHEAVAAHAGDIAALVVKPQALGGPDRAIDAIVAATAAGLEVIVTSMIDSAVGVAHAAHVAAACRLDTAHGLATSTMLETDVAPGLAIANGRLVMADAPGLGIGLVSPESAAPS